MGNLYVFSGWVFMLLFRWSGNAPHLCDTPLTFLAPDTILFCETLGNAELPANNQTYLGEGAPGASRCSAHIWNVHLIDGLCADTVSYSVRLFLFNSSNDVSLVNSSTVVRDTSGIFHLGYDTRSSDLSLDHPITKSGVPYTEAACSGLTGLHRIVIKIDSPCGDTTIENFIKIDDCSRPLASCVPQLNIAVPSSGLILVYAQDFNALTADDCTRSDDLIFSFSADEFMPSKRFDCEDIECNGSRTFMLDVWAADRGQDRNCDGKIDWGERNAVSCSTSMIIDGDIECEFFPIYGKVQTSDFEGISQVHVTLSDSVGVLQVWETAQDGYYHMNVPCLRTANDVEISCTRNDNHLNGVSTLDVIKVQKHLLGLEYLDSPYRLIAADVNNSGSINVLDLVDMRKLILGLTTEFPHNKSWRFIPESHVFPDPTHPWPFPEVDMLVSFTSNDFYGVKIGDVNGNAMTSATAVTDRQDRALFVLRIAQQEIKAGQTYVVPFHGEKGSDIEGFQFTFEFSGLELESVEPGMIDLREENLGVHTEAITLSWGSVTPVRCTDLDALFSITCIATRDGLLSEMITLSSAITPAEAYVLVDGAEYTVNPVLNFQGSTAGTIAGYSLHQNTPNPFSERTLIRFTMPESGEATLNIFNPFGGATCQMSAEFPAGVNTFIVEDNQLLGPGLWLYRLHTGAYSATKKMVLLE